jgi:NAD(P)H-nitrite reductase large subunit
MTLEEFNNLEKDFEVCNCMGVTLEEIQSAIQNGCSTVEEIVEESGAGSACELCRCKDEDEDKELYIDEIIELSKN